MKTFKRSKKIEEIVARMTLPRVQISIILMVTCLIGFLSSMLLLALGLDLMAVRYPLVVAMAYGSFLFLLKIWLWLQAHGGGSDIGDVIFDGPFPSDSVADGAVFGGGGDFAGAGAGGNWVEPLGIADTGSVSVGGGLDVDVGLDADEFGLLILAIVAAFAALLAIFYVIYIAPVLLAEIVIDGLLVSGLYRTMKNVERRYWLTTAIKKTVLPAILVAVMLGVSGWLLQKIAPDARSIGGVVHSIVK